MFGFEGFHEIFDSGKACKNTKSVFTKMRTHMKSCSIKRAALRFASAAFSFLWCVSIPCRITVSNRYSILEKRITLYSDIIASETKWLSDASLSNGAFAFRPISYGNTYINPYFSCYTLLALLSGQVTTERMELCQRAIDWHFTHLGPQTFDGRLLAATIFDYTAVVKDGVVISEHTDQTQDSTDSYSAAFLLVLDQFMRAGGSADYLSAHQSEFLGVLSVMLATLSKDGLTFAKPDYQVAYLMDNSEVWQALQAAEHLLKTAFLPASSANLKQAVSIHISLARVSAARNAIEAALETKLWNPSGGYYAPSLSNSIAAAYDPDKFYGDAISQLCPILYGVISPQSERAKALYQSFCARWNWETLAHVDTGATKYYWGMIAYCAALMQDNSRLDRFLELYQSAIMPDHAMPLFNSDAAWVVLACQLALRDCRDQWNDWKPIEINEPFATVC